MMIEYNRKGLITSNFFEAQNEIFKVLPEEYKNKIGDVITELRRMVRKSKADEIKIEHINNQPVNLTLRIQR